MVKGWKYYNHSLIPSTAPHEMVNMQPIKDGSIWKKCVWGGWPILARWTTEFDCREKTQFWYTIIDTPFDISELKSDYRRRIRIGLKNFKCKIISSKEYAQDMAEITLKDWATYPAKYRPHTRKIDLIKMYCNLKETVWGAFDINNQLSAFQVIEDNGSYYSMGQGKSNPETQKLQVNAALIASYLDFYAQDISNGKYISNGTRNIFHETNFNEDLCKKYGFRKAFCKLNVVYRFPFNIMVYCLYPCRKLIKNNNRIGSLIHSILLMEEIRRND